MVDPDPPTAKPLAQTCDCLGFKCPQRARPIVTLDEIVPCATDRHITVGRQFGRATVVQRAATIELSQTGFRVAFHEAELT